MAPSIAVSRKWEFVWGNTMTTPLIYDKILLMVSDSDVKGTSDSDVKGTSDSDVKR